MTAPETHETPLEGKKWRGPFLDALSQHGNVSRAIRAARVGRATVYRDRDADGEFKAAWEHARDLGLDSLEDVANARARRDSDTLLIFLLKAHRPEKYRETTRNINTNVQVDWDKVPADVRDAFIDGQISLDDVLRKL